MIAVDTVAAVAVIDWATRYSNEGAMSPESLKSTTANCESGTEPCTPVTIALASAFASAMEGPMLPVVSIAIRMSALTGLAGTATVRLALPLPPGATATAAVCPDADTVVAGATGVSCRSNWAISRIGRATTDARRTALDPRAERPTINII